MGFCPITRKTCYPRSRVCNFNQFHFWEYRKVLKICCCPNSSCFLVRSSFRKRLLSTGNMLKGNLRQRWEKLAEYSEVGVSFCASRQFGMSLSSSKCPKQHVFLKKISFFSWKTLLVEKTARLEKWPAVNLRDTFFPAHYELKHSDQTDNNGPSSQIKEIHNEKFSRVQFAQN